MTQTDFCLKQTGVFWTRNAFVAECKISQAIRIQVVKGWRLPANIHRLHWELGRQIWMECTNFIHVAHFCLAGRANPAVLLFHRSVKALGAGEDNA